MNQIKKLHYMARIDNQIYKQIFYKIRGNPERTYAIDKTKGKTNEKKTQVPQPAADGTTINIPHPPQNYHNIYVKVTDTKQKIYT